MSGSIECYKCDVEHEGEITDEELIRDGPDDWGWCWGKKPYSQELDEPYYACPQCKEDM